MNSANKREEIQTLKLQAPRATVDLWTASALRLGLSRNQYLLNLIEGYGSSLPPPKRKD